MTRTWKTWPQRAWAGLKALDWHLVLMLGPRHSFSAAQWTLLEQRSSISASVRLCAGLNALALGAMAAWAMPAPLKLGGFVVGVLMSLALLWQAARLWRRPTMRTLYLGYVWVAMVAFATTFLMGVVNGARQLEGHVGEAEATQLAMVLALLGSVGIWVLAMARNEMLAGWLREHTQQQQALALAQQLSSAQIQPHFLFNSLASLQHWVAVKDDRAAPLLQSLTAYLRATLPLFDRPLLAVGTEAEAVRRYLEVMQARLGERLHYEIDIAPEAAAALLPPGLLLTLVENAVEHGAQARLSGGEVALRAQLTGGELRVEVSDNGPGYCPPAVPGPQSGLGLRNTRWRLAQAFGDRARLDLGDRPEGGCLARLCVQEAGRAAPPHQNEERGAYA